MEANSSSEIHHRLCFSVLLSSVLGGDWAPRMMASAGT